MTRYYENIEFLLDNGSTDYDLDSQQSGFLSKFGSGNVAGSYPTWVEIRTNQTISVKVNSNTDDSITIASTDSPFVIAGVEISNLFLSNSSGNQAAVKLRFQLNPYQANNHQS